MTRPKTHRFEIRISGWLADHWSTRFDGLSIRHLGDGDTVLEGEVPDQAALFGVLHTLESLGLSIVSVRTAPAGEPL
jgi:hypothetical protein